MLLWFYRRKTSFLGIVEVLREALLKYSGMKWHDVWLSNGQKYMGMFVGMYIKKANTEKCMFAIFHNKK